MRRLLCVFLIVVAAACGDDDVDRVADDADPEPTAAVDPPTTTVPSTTTTSEGVTGTTAAGDHETPAAPPPADGAAEDEGRDEQTVLIAELSGDGPGSGRAELTFTAEGFCVDMAGEALTGDVTAAHVHEGTDGPAVVDIGQPTAVDGDHDTWNDACVAVVDEVRRRIESDPQAFSVDLHTIDSPDGAIRGQLTSATIFDRTLP